MRNKIRRKLRKSASILPIYALLLVVSACGVASPDVSSPNESIEEPSHENFQMVVSTNLDEVPCPRVWLLTGTGQVYFSLMLALGLSKWPDGLPLTDPDTGSLAIKDYEWIEKRLNNIVTLCIYSCCSQNNEINPGTKVVEQENGDVWIYPAGPTYVDEDMGVTVSFPEEYWSSIMLIKPDDSILNVYYREVKENEPLLTNGAVLATIIVTNKSDETENNWAKAVGTEYFAETTTKNYYVSIQAGGIISDVSDKDMLKNLSTYVEENINEVFTVIISD